MAQKRDKICFEEREFKGSRFRCLLLTHQPRPKVQAFLNSLVQPFATVGEKDLFMPKGFPVPDEARLGETPGFLSDEHRRVVTDWWLAIQERANTPNWDLVSTINGGEGLLLVEAKAHPGELKAGDCCGASGKNHEQIETVIQEASDALGDGWRLTVNSHYQLSNRFAWAWKVASLGVPVILVYLGFLNAEEMHKPFTSHEAWERCLLAYAEGTVPRKVWNANSIQVNGTPMIPLIRSVDVNVST
jgi:hypothetical protein